MYTLAVADDFKLLLIPLSDTDEAESDIIPIDITPIDMISSSSASVGFSNTIIFSVYDDASNKVKATKINYYTLESETPVDILSSVISCSDIVVDPSSQSASSPITFSATVS